MEVKKIKEMGRDLSTSLSLRNPLGIKLYEKEKDIPEEVKRPLEDYGARWTLCQGINFSRTLGVKTGFVLEDMFCMIGSSLFGMEDFDFSLYPHHVKDKNTAEKLDSIYEERNSIMKEGSTEGIVISPLTALSFEPDIIVVYGSAAQIGKIAKAFTWHGETVESLYFGAAGCSTIVKSYNERKPFINIPSGGEKVLAGTQEHEINIAFPTEKLDDVLEGIKGTNKMLPYPTVITTLMKEPSVPSDYEISYKDTD